MNMHIRFSIAYAAILCGAAVVGADTTNFVPASTGLLALTGGILAFALFALADASPSPVTGGASAVGGSK